MDTSKDIEDMAGVRLPDKFRDTLRKVNMEDTEYEIMRKGHIPAIRRNDTPRKKRKWKYNKKLNSRKYVLPKAMR